jgi:tetratricopeptide (TPR) repeat protein
MTSNNPKSLLKYISLGLFQLFFISALAQENKIDSLLHELSVVTGESRADVLIELADFYKSKEPLKAIKYADEAIDLSLNIKYSKGLIFGYKSKGIALGFKNKYDEAIQTLLKSNEVAEKNNDLITVAENCTNIASAYFVVLGNYNKALEYYLKTLKIYEQLDNKKGIAQALSGIGISYVAEKKFKEGIETHFKALAIFEQLDEKNEIKKMYVNIGNAYESNFEYSKALEFYSKALSGFNAVESPRGTAQTLYRIGSIYLKQGTTDKAIDNLQEAISINEKSDHQSSVAECLVLLGEAYKNKKDYDKALTSLLRSEEISQRLKKIETLSTACKALASVYELKNDYKNAFHYGQLHMQYYDSIYSAEKSKQIAEMQTRFDTEKKEKEIEILKQDKLLSQIYLALAVSTVVLLLIIGFLIINQQKLKNRKDRELSDKESQIMEERRTLMEAELQNRELTEHQLQNQLDFKNKELASYTLSVIQKNEILESLKQSVEALRSTPDDQVKQKLSGLISMVNYSFQLDKDWENFKIHFEQVHQNFLKKLIDQFPELSANDLKLAALIKLNLDNRGIAAILNISQESAKVARHRFRKKLNLPTEQNLLSFLNSIEQSAIKV